MTANRDARALRPGLTARWSLALLATLLLLALAGCAHEVPGAVPRFVYDPKAPSSPPDRPLLTLKDDDRILVLAPHPDDEVLAAGGLVQQALAKGLPVKVVFLTNGDNNEFAYLYFSKAFTLDSNSALDAGQTRALEALRAGRELGLDTADETFLGYPDFGTLDMWKNRWGDDREAFRSMFSEQSQVPYWFARTPDSPYKGGSILSELKEILAGFKPTKVFVSHPADTNPDHVAYVLYLRTALWDLEDKVQPEVYSYLTHYGAWPQPRGRLFEAPLEPPAKLDEAGRWVALPLQPDQVAKKFEAIKRHKTQYSAARSYLESYLRTNELFDSIKDIPLAPGAEGVVLLPSGTGVPAGSALPEGASPDGAQRRVRVEGNDLVFSVSLDPTSTSEVNTSLYAFGYRHDRPFGEMPKLYIEANSEALMVEERRQSMPTDAVRVSSSPGQIEVRIPLDTLGNPDRIFLTADASAEGYQLDMLPWVVLDLPGAP
jgi:LmbE family N-acetylglucosaminyl deacetylase